MSNPLIVTAAIIRDADRILITRRPEGSRYAGMWEFPGGKLDGDETPEDCLRREIAEELDLAVEVGEIYTVVYHRYDWGPLLLLVYNCTPRDGEIRNLQVAEHRYVTENELARFEFLPADRPIIDKLTQDARQHCRYDKFVENS